MSMDFRTAELTADMATNVVKICVSGKLTKVDYELFVPRVEEWIEEHRKRIRILFELKKFHGWTAGALWEDIRSDLKHFGDVEKIAMIGEKSWRHGMARFCKPFTSAQFRYFDFSQSEEARDWIKANSSG